jgi:chromosomal replication initiation ATPase DnaA
MASQLPLPLTPRSAMSREDFVVAPANAEAVAFIDSWPDWPVAAAALHGPAGSGKTHLAEVWARRANAQSLKAAELNADVLSKLDSARAIVVENVDAGPATAARDTALFRLMESATRATPLLLTGHEPPSAWPATLPDLASRFASMLAFALWAPGDELLAAIARKLFTDRQLNVPEAVIVRMIRSLERSPSAIRAFVAEADTKALAEGRAVTLALIRELLARDGEG